MQIHCGINKHRRYFTGSGIGRGLAIGLAKLGCKLVLWDVNEEANQETASEIKKLGGQVSAYTVDLSKREDVYSVADKVNPC